MSGQFKERGRDRGHTLSSRPRSQDTDEAAEAKRKLEELFGGGKTESPSARSTSGPVRRTSTGRVYASPRKSTGRQPSEYRLRLERLRMAREPDQIRIATDSFLEFHQLPDEVDILYKVLQHPSEKVLRDAMGQLSALLMQGRLGGTMLLQDRLKELESRVRENSTLSYIKGLRDQLESLEEG